MKIEDYNEYYIQGSDHYLIPKDVFKELFNEMMNWKEEAKELKKQLEELDKKLFFTKNELEMRQKSIDNKLNQQKEFIEYLEYQVKLQEKLNDIHLATGFEEILSKYKEIIGDDK